MTIHLISLLTIPMRSYPLNLPIPHGRIWQQYPIPHTLPAIKYRDTLLLGILPLGKGVQSRPFEPLSCHLAPQLAILNKLSH